MHQRIARAIVNHELSVNNKSNDWNKVAKQLNIDLSTCSFTVERSMEIMHFGKTRRGEIGSKIDLSKRIPAHLLSLLYLELENTGDEDSAEINFIKLVNEIS
jgi:hypothetical protein